MQPLPLIHSNLATPEFCLSHVPYRLSKVVERQQIRLSI